MIDLLEVEENEATVVDPEPITAPAQVDLEEGLVDDASAQPVEVSEAATTPAEESEVVDYPAARQAVADYLEQVIKTYGAQAEIQIDASDKQVIYNIKTDKSGLVIGRHGRIINSLQTLAQVMLHNLYRRRISVLLNVGDYRDRRAMVLEQMAERAANDVLETRQPVFLEALPAYERKQIHYHISKHDHLSTHSEGKEPNRYLVVEYVE